MLLGIVVVLHLPGLANRVFNNDEAYVATAADVIAGGGRLYVDVGRPQTAGAVLPLPLALRDSPAAISCGSRGSRQWWLTRPPRRWCGCSPVAGWAIAAGLIAGVLAALASVTVTPGDAQSAEFEVFMMPLVLAAMVLADRKRPLGSGLAIGAGDDDEADSGDHTAAAGLDRLAEPCDSLGDTWPCSQSEQPCRSSSARCCSGPDDSGSGSSAGPTVNISTSATAGLGVDGAPHDLGQQRRSSGSTSPSFVPGGHGVALPARRHRRLAVAGCRPSIGIVSGTRFFGHYYWQTPSAAVHPRGPRCDTGCRKVGEAIAVATMAVTAAGAAIAAVAFRISAARAPTTRRSPTMSRPTRAADEQIFVWGHEPSVFWAAGRLPASRVITTGFLTGHTTGRPAGFDSIDKAVPGLWDDVMADLDSRIRPRSIFDTQPDDPLHPPDYPMRDYPPIEEFVAGNYQLGGRRRKDLRVPIGSVAMTMRRNRASN